MSTPAVTVDPNSYAEFLKAQIASQANTTGLTQLGPGGTPSIPQSQPRQQPGQQQNQQFGPGGAGANKRQSMQNLVKAAQSGANQFAQFAEQKQQREYEQVITKFTQSQQGVAQAQAQILQATQALKSDPNDPQAKQLLQQGQTALKINQANLNDMATDKKQHKIITKAFGIDDKNADSPERAAAKAALQKQMGVNQQAAGLVAGQPQTQQLSPQGQAQQTARQAGAIGAPASQGQVLTAATAANKTAVIADGKVIDQTLKAEQINNSAGLNTDKLVESLPAKGLVAEKSEDGSYKRNPDGTLMVRNLTPAELKDNPVLAQKYQENQAAINLKVQQAQSSAVNARANMMRAAKYQAGTLLAQNPQTVQNWAKAVSDPKSGVTLAQVPAAARGAVVNAVVNGGMKIAKPLTATEINRADLAGNAVDNISQAQAILDKRPDLFGPSGWGKSKMEMALAGGDPDAVSFQADIKLANLPAVGIHGLRGKYAVEDLSKLDSNVYLNKESMGEVLSDINRSASEFKDSGGRQAESPTAKPDKAVDDFLLNLK